MVENKEEFNKFLMRQLRKISYLWGPRGEALKVSRVSRGNYQCAECSRITKRGYIAIDHIDPVIPLEGFTNWDDVIGRLFCPLEGFQVLCKECHKVKTTSENKVRRELRIKAAVATRVKCYPDD